MSIREPDEYEFKVLSTINGKHEWPSGSWFNNCCEFLKAKGYATGAAPYQITQEGKDFLANRKLEIKAQEELEHEKWKMEGMRQEELFNKFKNAGLNTQIIHCLLNYELLKDVSSVEDLANTLSEMSDKELLRMYNFGKRALQLTRVWIAKIKGEDFFMTMRAEAKASYDRQVLILQKSLAKKLDRIDVLEKEARLQPHCEICDEPPDKWCEYCTLSGEHQPKPKLDTSNIETGG